MALTEQEKSQAYQYALNGADFTFLPSSELSTLIVQGKHPYANAIAEPIKLAYIKRYPVHLDPAMVMKYCTDTLDVRNKWVLDHGDIQVTPDAFAYKNRQNKIDRIKEGKDLVIPEHVMRERLKKREEEEES